MYKLFLEKMNPFQNFFVRLNSGDRKTEHFFSKNSLVMYSNRAYLFCHMSSMSQKNRTRRDGEL